MLIDFSLLFICQERNGGRTEADEAIGGVAVALVVFGFAAIDSQLCCPSDATHDQGGLDIRLARGVVGEKRRLRSNIEPGPLCHEFPRSRPACSGHTRVVVNLTDQQQPELQRIIDSGRGVAETRPVCGNSQRGFRSLAFTESDETRATGAVGAMSLPALGSPSSVQSCICSQPDHQFGHLRLKQ